MSTPVVRFAPSPTGHLHVGGARTALFNWLYARSTGGQFHLRIEDTDRERSKSEYLDSILESMRWLGLDWDGELVYQSKREDRHREIVEKLLETGNAYRCFCTPEELTEMRETALREKQPLLYDGRWRDHPGPYPDRPFSIRFKAPREGETVIPDAIQGDVVIRHKDVDDLIIARSDGSPTYNLAVVVDDADMGMTHVIRGDDHLNNTTKQTLLYRALDWTVPTFAHVPMILGKDKARLSKRHGATSVAAYRDQGYLPEAFRNYLVRLGWSHGDQEIFTLDEMVEHFGFDKVGKSPSVFDSEKLDWLNAHYLKTLPSDRIVEAWQPHLSKRGYPERPQPWLERASGTVVERANTLEEMADAARVYYLDEVHYDEKADAKFLKAETAGLLDAIVAGLESIADFTAPEIEKVYKGVMKEREAKLPHLAQPTRIALTGGTVSPSVYDLVELVGRETAIERLRAAADHCRAKAGSEAAGGSLG